MADLKIRNLQKGFDGTAIIQGVDLDIRDREFVVFVGPSGCGKSTLLRMVAGLDRPSTGTIALDGKAVTRPGPDRGMVHHAVGVLVSGRRAQRGGAAGERGLVGAELNLVVQPTHVAEGRAEAVVLVGDLLAEGLQLGPARPAGVPAGELLPPLRPLEGRDRLARSRQPHPAAFANRSLR